MNVKEIGVIIKNKRKSLGLTQKYFSAFANVGVRFISDLENGKETIEVGKLLKVLEALNLKVEIKVHD